MNGPRLLVDRACLPSCFALCLPSLLIQVAGLYQLNPGLCAAVHAVVERIHSTMRRAALVAGQVYAPSATIAAGRAMWGWRILRVGASGGG
jgi:hypothetical protein